MSSHHNGSGQSRTKQTDMDQLYRGITEPTLTTETYRVTASVILSQSEGEDDCREPIRGPGDAEHN